jgi:hypothetical protein
LLGFLKWRRLSGKLLKYDNAEVESIIEEQKKWFTSKLQKVKNIRKETKDVNEKW